ncbi:MAG: 30S ribosomal protein S5 [bacterium]|nr:30S ribosomal protein S5 [bacterium]
MDIQSKTAQPVKETPVESKEVSTPIVSTAPGKPVAQGGRDTRNFRQNHRPTGKGGSGRRGGGGRPHRFSHERARPEFEHKVINVRRVTRVVAGGRRFAFSVALVAGDRKGSVGVGIGKAGDTALAIEKAMRSAKRNMIKIKLTKNMSIPHDVKEKFSSARIIMMPALGRGIIAGSSVRNVLHLAGIKDVTAKVLSGSKNKLNIARVAVKALSTFAESKKKAGESHKTSIVSHPLKTFEAKQAEEAKS